MIRILTSDHDAWVLTASIEAIEGIPRPGTDQWGEPIPHPDGTRWAVVLSDLSEALPGDVPMLTPDWYPESP